MNDKNKTGQVIAIGGGGFGRNPNKPVIEEYIVNQSSNSKPNILFFSTGNEISEKNQHPSCPKCWQGPD